MFASVETKYVKSPAEWNAVWERIKGEEFFGFDVEQDAKGVPRVIQISTATTAVVLHLLHFTGLPETLSQMLVDPDIFKVGVGVHGDLDKLRETYKVKCDGGVDIAWVAYMIGVTQEYRSLGFLGEKLVGENKAADKGLWDRQNLDQEQIAYAAKDAWLGVAITQKIYTDSLTRKEKARISMPQWLAMVRTDKSDIEEYLRERSGQPAVPPEAEDADGQLRAIAQMKEYTHRLDSEVREQVRRLEKNIEGKKPKAEKEKHKHKHKHKHHKHGEKPNEDDLIVNVI